MLKETTSETYVKLKEFTITGRNARFFDATIRVSYMADIDGGGGAIKFCQNGEQVAILEGIHSWDTYVTNMEHINDGDTLELWAKGPNLDKSSVKEFRLMGITAEVPSAGVQGFTAEVTG